MTKNRKKVVATFGFLWGITTFCSGCEALSLNKSNPAQASDSAQAAPATRLDIVGPSESDAKRPNDSSILKDGSYFEKDDRIIIEDTLHVSTTQDAFVIVPQSYEGKSLFSVSFTHEVEDSSNNVSFEGQVIDAQLDSDGSRFFVSVLDLVGRPRDLTELDAEDTVIVQLNFRFIDNTSLKKTLSFHVEGPLPTIAMQTLPFDNGNPEQEVAHWVQGDFIIGREQFSNPTHRNLSLAVSIGSSDLTLTQALDVFIDGVSAGHTVTLSPKKGVLASVGITRKEGEKDLPIEWKHLSAGVPLNVSLRASETVSLSWAVSENPLEKCVYPLIKGKVIANRVTGTATHEVRLASAQEEAFSASAFELLPLEQREGAQFSEGSLPAYSFNANCQGAI